MSHGPVKSGEAPSQGRFLGQAGFNVMADAIGHGLGLLGGFALAKLLTPAAFGLIQGFKILYALAPLASLGAERGVHILMPMARGREGEEAAWRVASTGLWLYVIPQAVLMAALAAFAVFLAPGEGWVRWGYLASAASIFLLNIKSILAQILLSREQIRQRALANLAHSLTHFAVLIPVAWFAGIAAFWVADWATLWAVWILLGALERDRLRSFDRSAVWPLFSYGFPIFIGSQIGLLLVQIDRMLILCFLGVVPLAFYGIGNLATRGLLVLPRSISHPWTPRMLRLLASGEESQVRHQTDQLCRALSWVGVYLAVAGCAVVWVVVPWLLPRYVTGIPVALALLLALPMQSTNAPLGNVPMYYGWYGRVLVINGMLLVAAAALDVLAITRGWGIAGVALMTSAVNVLQSAFNYYLSWRMLGDTVGSALARTSMSFLPMVVLLAGLPVCFAAVLAAGCEGTLVTSLLTMALFGLITLPVPIKLWKELELATRSRALLRTRGWIN